MRRARLTIILLGLGFTCCGVNAARSESSRIALVITNSQYANFPAMSRCSPAAAMARDSLRAKGFEVMERNNLGRGEFDTAIGLLARRVAAAPPTAAVMYYCGYAAEFNNRSFLLPVSAVLTRDNDLLSQGILVKSVVDSLRRTPDSAGLVLLDVFRTPDAPGGRPSRLAEHVPASSFAVIAATNEPNGEGATALALGLRDELSIADAGVNSVTNGLRRRLAKEPVTAEVIAAMGDAALAAETRPAPPPVASIVPPPPPPPTATASAPSSPSKRRRNSRSWSTRIRCPTGSPPGPDAARNHGILQRPDRRHLRPRNAGRHSPLPVRDQGRTDGPPDAEQATQLVNSAR